MLALLLIHFLVQTDSLLIQFNEQVYLGNYSYAHKLVEKTLENESVELKKAVIENVLHNHESHKRYNRFYLADSERIPATKTQINITHLLKNSVRECSYLYNFSLYEYLMQLPRLTKIKKKKSSLISKLSRQSAYDELFKISILNKNVKSSRILSKKVNLNKFKYEHSLFSTNFLKRTSTEGFLLKFMQQDSLSEAVKSNIKLDLAITLLKKDELERATYYIDQVDESLVNHYKLTRTKEHLSTTFTEHFFQREFLLHQFDLQFYSDLDSFLRKDINPKNIPKKLLWYMSKAQSDFARIHISYLLYNTYKKQRYSRDRNRKLKHYSDLCYTILGRLFKL